MNINFEEIMKKQIERIANDEIDKLINEKVDEFHSELLSKKDGYVTELMKMIRIFSEQQTIDNMPRYLITKEYSMYVESPKYIIFRNGYSKNSPSIKCKIEITTGFGNEKWGAEPNKKYYVLRILSVEEIENRYENNSV